MSSTGAPAAPRRSQKDRRSATRGALLRSARELFAEQGYAATSLDEVVRRAGTTRGALYHYFESKAHVFAAVVEALDEEFAAEVIAAARPGGDVPAMIQLGVRAYLAAGARSENARILTEAVSVLGGATYHSASAASCLTLLRLALDAAGGERLEVPGDSEVLAVMLLGAINEAALLVAGGADASRVGRTVDAFLVRLFVKPAVEAPGSEQHT